MNGDFIQEDEFDYLTEEKADELKSSNAFRGDLVITHRGTIGQVGLIPRNSKYQRYVVSQSQLKVSLNRELAYPEYIYYFFKSRVGQYRLLMNASQVGVPAIARASTSVKAIKIELPPLPEQQAIAHILGKLDDKIELNRQMNQTLEAMAQALFKSWFVDFDPVIDNALAAGPDNYREKFPEALKSKFEKRKKILGRHSEGGTTEESPKSSTAAGRLLDTNPALAAQFPSSFVFSEALNKWIPKGWEVKRAVQVSDISIGKTPPRKERHWFEAHKNDSNVIWVSIKDMGDSGMFIGDSSEYLTRESVDKFNVKRVPNNTVILSFKMTVGRVAITSNELCTNEAIAHFANLQESLSSGYIYQYLKSFDFENLGSTSSIATAVNSKLIKQMPILIPSKETLNRFKQSHDVLSGKIHTLQKENETLTQLRDTLLPQLISGKVKVPEEVVEMVGVPEEVIEKVNE